jgi:ATP-dependent Clp protease ATP-binding subunit ClpB
VIQRHLQDPLAEKILAGEIGDGETVQVSANAQGLLINGSVVSAEAA